MVLALSYFQLALTIFMAESTCRRYPERIRKVSFALLPYELDYNSDDDFDNPNIDEDISESDSQSSCSDIHESSLETSVVSFMDESIPETETMVGRDGTIWTDILPPPIDITPTLHLPRLTLYSQSCATISGEPNGGGKSVKYRSGHWLDLL